MTPPPPSVCRNTLPLIFHPSLPVRTPTPALLFPLSGLLSACHMGTPPTRINTETLFPLVQLHLYAYVRLSFHVSHYSRFFLGLLFLIACLVLVTDTVSIFEVLTLEVRNALILAYICFGYGCPLR